MVMRKKCYKLIFLIIVILWLFIPNLHAFDFDITSKQVANELNTLKNAQTATDYLKLGWIYYIFKNDSNKAVTYLEKSIELDSQIYESYFILGLIKKGQGRYREAFNTWLKCLDFDRLENSFVVLEIMYLNYSSEDTQKLLKKFENMSKSSSYILLKPHLSYEMGYLYRKTGQLNKSLKAYKKIGFIDKWMIIGPFDNKEKMGLNEVYPPEKEIDFTKAYSGKVKDVNWRKLDYLDYDQLVNFDEVLYPYNWVVAYGLTYVYCPQEKNAVFRIGSDDAVKIWFNDCLIFKNENYQRFAPDQYAIPVRLNKGWNKVLVKVCEGWGAWKFGLRITDFNGKPLKGLKYSTETKPYTKKDILPKIKTRQLISIKEQLQQKIKENPNNLFARYILAEYLRMLDLNKDSIKEYDDLIKLYPDSACFLYEQGWIFSNDDNIEKAIKNYKKAVFLNKNHLESLYRIAGYYYDDGQYDRALYYVTQISKINPNFLDNRLLTAKIYRDKGWYLDAYIEMKELIKLSPTTPNYLAWMGDMAGDIDKYEEEIEFYEKALMYEQKSYYAMRELIKRYKLLGQEDEVIKLYYELLKFYPLRMYYYVELAEYYASIGEFEKSFEACQQASLISPDNFFLLKEKGELYYYTGQTEQAVKEWEKALAVRPNYQDLREYIEFVQQKEETFFTKYSESEDEIRSLINTQIKPGDYPEAPAIELLNRKMIQVFSDGSCFNYIHKIIKILNKKGIEEYGQIDMLGTKNLKIKKSIVITPQGEELEITEISGKTISPPALEIGSIIEYEYTYSSRYHLIGGYFYDSENFEYIVPILRKCYVISIPIDKKLKTYAYNIDLEFHQERYKDNNVYIWEAYNIPKIYFEKNLPGIGDFIKFIIVSTIPSWEYLARWEDSLVDDQLEIDPQIKEKIFELIAGKQTEQEKVKAIYYFITKEVRYLSLKHDVFGWKSKRSTKIFADRYGDCKDKAILMMAMLKEIGIKAYYALLSTRNYSLLKKDIPAPYMNHAIVYIPELDGKQVNKFLDMTAIDYSYNSLPHTDEGVYAMVFKRPGYEFIKIPLSKANENVSNTNITIELVDEKMEGKSSDALTGKLSGLYRGKLKDERLRRKIIEDELNRYLPGNELIEYEILNENNLEKPFVINCEFKVPSLLSEIGHNQYTLALIGKVNLVKELAPSKERHYDLELRFAGTYNLEEVVILPDGYIITRLPKDFKIENEFVSYEIKYSKEKNNLKIERTFALLKSRIKKEDYYTFRRSLIKIDKIEQRNIVIKKD